MSVSLYMDVHVRRAVTLALRLRSIDVLTAQEDGSAELDDDRLLQRATLLGRILVSLRTTTCCAKECAFSGSMRTFPASSIRTSFELPSVRWWKISN